MKTLLAMWLLTEWFVAPDGSPSGNGSKNRPWDLLTALQHPSSVKPGDTINLRGGTYFFRSAKMPVMQRREGLFTSVLRGSESNPIKVRSFPGEWAVIDGAITGSSVKHFGTMQVHGAFTWYMNFEITNSDPNGRNLLSPPPCHPPFSPPFSCDESNRGDRRGNSIDVYGPGNKLINLVIHDAGQGIGMWDGAVDSEAYGNIIYNNGWDASNDNNGQPSATSGRLAGHGLYAQNRTGFKLIRDNIIFNNFGDGFHAAGSGAASVTNFTLQGNIHFNDRFLFTGPPVTNITVRQNFTFGNALEIGGSLRGNRNISVTENFLVNPGGLGMDAKYLGDFRFERNTVQAGVLVSMNYPEGFAGPGYAVDNNRYYRPAKSERQKIFNSRFPAEKFREHAIDEWRSRWSNQGVTFDGHSSFGPLPESPDVIVRPNEYDPSRAHVVVYNWPLADSVTIDLALAGLAKGDRYEIRNVQDYFGDVWTGVFDGQPVAVDMRAEARKAALPIGGRKPMGPLTFPYFGAFVVSRIAAAR